MLHVLLGKYIDSYKYLPIIYFICLYYLILGNSWLGKGFVFMWYGVDSYHFHFN